MSRCFPFPPPGYERKPITDDPDLLKKEKRREKRHKKDKEKKHSKEKREKDKSEGKHKEKKDKKDKHRDKKRDREKSKTNTPDEKNLHGQFAGHNGELRHHNNEQNTEKVQFPYQNGDLLKNKKMVGDTENFKFVQEPDRRVRDEEKGTGSYQFAVGGRKDSVSKVETHGRQATIDVAAFGGHMAVSRTNGATPPLDNRRVEKMREKGSDVVGFGSNVMVPNRVNGATPPPLGSDRQRDKDREKKMEKLIEKSEQMKTKKVRSETMVKSDLVDVANEGNLKKRKAIETNGVCLSHENETRPNKMARPVSNISPENGRKLDFLQNPGPSLLDKQATPLNSFNACSKGGQKVNGMVFSPPPSVSAKKPPSPAFSRIPSKPSPIKSPSPPVITHHVSAQLPLPTTKPPPSIPLPMATHHQLPPLSSPPQPPAKQPMARPKPPPAVVNKVAPPPPPPPKKKAPHPDTKYLNQILSVPKLDPWCGSDDQEWLFSRKAGGGSRNPGRVEPEVQVWSEAKHIESVDVCALPYVIPY